MLRPAAVSLRPRGGSHLSLTFDNRVRCRLDASLFTTNKWFEALMMPSYFRLVATNAYPVERPFGEASRQWISTISTKYEPTRVDGLQVTSGTIHNLLCVSRALPNTFVPGGMRMLQ